MRLPFSVPRLAGCGRWCWALVVLGSAVCYGVLRSLSPAIAELPGSAAPPGLRSQWTNRSPRLWAPSVYRIGWQPGHSDRFQFTTFGCFASRAFLNGEELRLEALGRPELCRDAVLLNLGARLVPGDNTLVLWGRRDIVSTHSALSVVWWRWRPVTTLAVLGLWLAAAFLAAQAARRLGLGRVAVATTLAFLAYAAVWLLIWPSTRYTNDLSGHVGYLRHMAETGGDYLAFRGAQCFQPPTYYALAAVPYRLAQLGGSWESLLAVRCLSIALFALFLILGLRLLQESGLSAGSLREAAALFCFWPAFILFATRISNDVLVLVPWTAGVLFLARWTRGEARAWAWATFCLAGALAAKSNAAVLLLTMVGTAALAGWRRPALRQTWWRREAVAGYAACGLSLALVFSRSFFEAGAQQNEEAWRAQFGASAAGTLRLSHFLTLDLPGLLRAPFVGASGPQLSFFDYYLRTALFGEFVHAHVGLARLLVVVVLLQLAWTLGTLPALVRRRPWDCAPHLLLIVGCVLATMVFMLMRNFTPCQDFRFSLGAVPSYAVLVGWGLDVCRERRWRAWRLAGATTALLAPLCGILFYLSQGTGVPRA